MDYIALAIPVFFLLIGVEIAVARVLERDSYRLSDSVGDLSCGVLQQVSGGVPEDGAVRGYVFVYSRYRRFAIPADAAWAWVALLPRRRLPLLLVPPPQPRGERGLGRARGAPPERGVQPHGRAAAGRLPAAVSWVFYLPLALVGFPPAMFLAVSAFDTLYQFWIHTRLVGRLGPLEWVLNTPSHHRVHHGRNPRYIDRNHGGTLIVWDRLFGTFARGARGARLRHHDGRSRASTRSGPTSTTGWRCGTWRGGRHARSTGCACCGRGRAGGPTTSAATLAPARGGPRELRQVRRAAARGDEALRARAVRAGARGPRRPTSSGATRLDLTTRVLGAGLIAWSLAEPRRTARPTVLGGRPRDLRGSSPSRFASALLPRSPLARGALVLLALGSAVLALPGPAKGLPLAPELR